MLSDDDEVDVTLRVEDVRRLIDVADFRNEEQDIRIHDLLRAALANGRLTRPPVHDHT